MVPSDCLPARHRRLPRSLLWLLGLASAALTAQADPTARPGRPDPLDPQASVPALVYRPSLVPIQPSADGKPVSWREANDNVARIGGWRVYARQAQQPDPGPAASPPPPLPAPAQQGHAGHKTP